MSVLSIPRLAPRRIFCAGSDWTRLRGRPQEDDLMLRPAARACMCMGCFPAITFCASSAPAAIRYPPRLSPSHTELAYTKRGAVLQSSFLETVPQLRASAPVPTPTPALVPTPSLAPCPSHPITGSAPPLGDLAPNPSALEQGVRTAQQQVMEVQMDLTVMEGCMSKLTAESKHGHRRLELELEALKTHVRRSDALALYELAAIRCAAVILSPFPEGYSEMY